MKVISSRSREPDRLLNGSSAPESRQRLFMVLFKHCSNACNIGVMAAIQQILNRIAPLPQNTKGPGVEGSYCEMAYVLDKSVVDEPQAAQPFGQCRHGTTLKAENQYLGRIKPRAHQMGDTHRHNLCFACARTSYNQLPSVRGCLDYDPLFGIRYEVGCVDRLQFLTHRAAPSYA